MDKVNRKTNKSWIQAIGLFFIALVLALSMAPTKSYAFNPFNGKGFDGYFLSLTNDPGNVRVVPVVVYDNHPKKQKSSAFIEYADVKVNYSKWDYNAVPFPDTIDAGDKGPKNFIKWAREAPPDKYHKITKGGQLAWTFPGFAGQKKAKNYDASQVDLDRALWISDTLVQEFNSALSMFHRTVQKYGNKDLEVMSPNKFANMSMQIAGGARKAQKGTTNKVTYHGVTFEFSKATGKDVPKRIPSGVPKSSYIKMKLVAHKGDSNGVKDVSAVFIEFVPKGYREGQPLYGSLDKVFQEGVEKAGSKDQKYLNWMMIAMQANSNWAGADITFSNIGQITRASKFEQFLADTGSNTLAGIRQMLGLYSSSDLIMNNGVRGTDSYYNGIMPKTWMNSADVLHWISYAMAWMLIVGAIVKLLIERNLAAINPSARVDMINGIKNLMIVGFALSIYDLVFAGLTQFNFLIVDVLSASGVGVETFGTAPVSAGMLASVIVGIVFFCLDVYFNFFYISRALMVAILYAVGPLYVASIAFGEKYRQMFGNFVKELIGNIYVQTFQAIILVFFVGISVGGNLRTVETLVLLFCFIPMSKFFKESVGASGSTTDALNGSALGAGAGLAAGLVGSAFKRGGGDKGKGGSKEGGADIRTKSGSQFGGGGGRSGGGPVNAKSLAGGSGGGGNSMKDVSGGGSSGGSGGKGGHNPSTGKQFGSSGKTKGRAAMGAAATGAKAAGKGLVAGGAAVVGAGLVAGGAATGMRGASQIGGFMVGEGMGKMNEARKEAGLGKDGMESAKGAILDGKASRNANKVNAAGSGNTEGTPTPNQVMSNNDDSTMYSYNKAGFSNATGITSMRDLDNEGNEMELGTDYVQGQGFINGKSSGLGGSDYEEKMDDMVEAFQNNDTNAIADYQANGIKNVTVDRNTNRVSMIVDKERFGVQGAYNSGDQIHLQRANNSRSTQGNHEREGNPLKEALYK